MIGELHVLPPNLSDKEIFANRGKEMNKLSEKQEILNLCLSFVVLSVT
jgi:hypothetical protein